MMNRALQPVRWITSICVLLVLALLAWQCIDIYRVGNAPENLDANGVHIQSVYRMDDVTARLSRLAWPLGGGVALIAVSAVLHFVCGKQKAEGVQLSVENRLRLMKKRVAELPDAAKNEERCRLGLKIGAAEISIVLAVCCLTYLLNQDNFTSWDLEHVMGQMMLHVAPWVILGFAVLILASFLCKASMERELAALKDAPKAKPNAAEPRKLPVNAIRIALYALAVLFIVLGVMNGGWYDVLVKAINICTECIGLG